MTSRRLASILWRRFFEHFEKTFLFFSILDRFLQFVSTNRIVLHSVNFNFSENGTWIFIQFFVYLSNSFNLKVSSVFIIVTVLITWGLYIFIRRCCKKKRIQKKINRSITFDISFLKKDDTINYDNFTLFMLNKTVRLESKYRVVTWSLDTLDEL